ncbi:MAG: hypothetical protein M1839_008149 [Geoglossum umbratile]|nr:MAG: hypothetical protein M1839_008149 [Geoglossum umbratile]
MSYPVAEHARVDSLGQVVSLEGDIQAIITQLRLLPPSPRVLTLPPFSRSLSRAPIATESEARSFVLQAHRTFTRRCEQARSFLLSSPADQPRLVLMNGGCVSARRICISKIAEELAGGNVDEGEQIFNELVRHGVAGLEEPVTPKPVAKLADARPSHGETNHHSDQNLSFREARYVVGGYDELVQPPVDSGDVDNFLESAPEDFSVEHPHHLKPFAVQTATSSVYSQDNGLYDDLSANGDSRGPEHAAGTPQSRRRVVDKQSSPGEAYRSLDTDDHRDSVYARALVDNLDIELRNEADGVVYGKAYAVSIKSNNGGDHHSSPRKVRSIPEFRNRDEASRHRAQTLEHLHTLEQAQDRNRTPLVTTVGISHSPVSPASPVSPVSPSPGLLVFPHKTTQSGESDTGSFAGSGKTCVPSVDHGTDAGLPPQLNKDAGAQVDLVKHYVQPHAQPSEEPPFEPVFPLVEDLIITFLDDGHRYEVFESVVQSYKNGSYPPLPITAAPTYPHSAARSRGRAPNDGVRLTRYSIMTVETDVELVVHSNANYSHYRDTSLASNTNTTPRWPKRKTSLTNSPTLISNAQRFLEFYPLNFKTCLGAQDAFRMMLSGNIPALSLDNVQFSSPLQVYGSWKPVLRTDHGLDSRGRTVDQIIAVGYENGVHKDLFQTIVGQIERLGVKKSGLSKASHVDARYLISNALQSIAQQSPIDDKTADPMAHPSVLAEILVPQIESYLAANESTRLLVLKFDPNMAQTMIELRRIFGDDIFKIATVTKSPQDSSIAAIVSQPSFDNDFATRTRRAEKLDRFFGETVRPTHSSGSSVTSPRPSSSSSKQQISLALPREIDFNVSCTATSFEITDFLSDIRETLISKNHFFETEHKGHSPPPIRRAPSTPRIGGKVPPPLVLGGSRPAAAKSEEKWKGFFDSEEDEIDRVMMPVVTRRVVRKNNSGKAMKWLGLS